MFRLGKFRFHRLGCRQLTTRLTSSSEKKFIADDVPPQCIKLLPRSKYGGESMVTLLTGDTTIGLQGASYIKTLFKSAKVPIVFESFKVGIKDTNDTEFVTSVQRNRNAIHVDLQFDPKEKHKSLLLNSELNLYACITRLHSIPGYNCRYPNLDITVAIQNNSGDYTKLEYEPVKGLVETLKINLDESIRNYLRFVYNYATKNCRKKITFGHKMEELPITDGHFLAIAKEMQSDYPNIEIEMMRINKLIRRIVTQPTGFDMICTSVRYGTFVAAICSAVCGGASLFSAIEIGDHHAVFKPLQTKLSVTDCRELSPYGVTRASIDILRHLQYDECAETLEEELFNTMVKRNVRTTEFGGCDSGEFVICDIANNLKCKFY